MMQVQTTQAASPDRRRQLFVVMLGETLHEAVVRHRSAYGPGALIMARNFNAMPAARPIRRQAVA
jgi:hypothetical protein